MAPKKKTKKKATKKKKFNILATHPPLENRLSKLNVQDKRTLTNNATSLFTNYPQIEKDMTAFLTQQVHDQLLLQELHKEAVKREGRCAFCRRQHTTLKALIKHEAKCRKRPKDIKS